MRMRVGDIIVNPWVQKEFNGELNPNYATIYLGNKQCLDINGKIGHFAFDTKVNKWDKDEPEREWKVIGHVNLKDAILDSIKSKEAGKC